MKRVVLTGALVTGLIAVGIVTNFIAITMGVQPEIQKNFDRNTQKFSEIEQRLITIEKACNK